MINVNDSINNDILYTGELDSTIDNFCRITDSKTTIPQLVDIMKNLSQSQILNVLIQNPTDPQARACVQNEMNRHPYPRKFLSRFLAIVTAEINVVPNAPYYLNQSYNAKVITTNIKPPTKLTTLTARSRSEELRQDMGNSTIFTASKVAPPQTIRLKFTPEMLPKCINAMADYSTTIEEGNRVNGCEVDGYIKSNIRY